ncbi:hypothetical protein BC477_10605 [Clavibacter michiganensis subsp. michiganensis]|uniref:Uncharacterized protein n=1 Tax=Clavibacter michiganensis subsp. michiganensis TaxID=33013 RepID=A0A251XP21_CLAMM|nr:hypothetical protein BC477_10605 [Clavibacter michiganensis subsp. michiganensis]OUE05176.1 hypothetical protein CMMCAS07_09525 [Clavibacter michiganensis subsp. michiganensis]
MGEQGVDGREHGRLRERREAAGERRRALARVQLLRRAGQLLGLPGVTAPELGERGAIRRRWISARTCATPTGTSRARTPRVRRMTATPVAEAPARGWIRSARPTTSWDSPSSTARTGAIDVGSTGFLATRAEGVRLVVACGRAPGPCRAVAADPCWSRSGGRERRRHDDLHPAARRPERSCPSASGSLEETSTGRSTSSSGPSGGAADPMSPRAAAMRTRAIAAATEAAPRRAARRIAGVTPRRPARRRPRGRARGRGPPGRWACPTVAPGPARARGSARPLIASVADTAVHGGAPPCTALRGTRTA